MIMSRVEFRPENGQVELVLISGERGLGNSEPHSKEGEISLDPWWRGPHERLPNRANLVGAA